MTLLLDTCWGASGPAHVVHWQLYRKDFQSKINNLQYIGINWNDGKNNNYRCLYNQIEINQINWYKYI